MKMVLSKSEDFSVNSRGDGLSSSQFHHCFQIRLYVWAEWPLHLSKKRPVLLSLQVGDFRMEMDTVNVSNSRCYSNYSFHSSGQEQRQNKTCHMKISDFGLVHRFTYIMVAVLVRGRRGHTEEKRHLSLTLITQTRPKKCSIRTGMTAMSMYMRYVPKRV